MSLHNNAITMSTKKIASIVLVFTLVFSMLSGNWFVLTAQAAPTGSAVAVSPSFIDFGSVEQSAHPSATQTVTVTNIGTTPVTLNDLSTVTLSENAPFAFSPWSSAILQPGELATMTVQLTYTDKLKPDGIICFTSTSSPYSWIQLEWEVRGLGSVPRPYADPAVDVVPAGSTVALACQDPDATIYYTTGASSAPTASSTEYTTPIMITDKIVLQAIAVNGQSSNVMMRNYNVLSASPLGGAVTTGTGVSLSCTHNLATIHYTIDGSIPTAASPKYITPIAVDSPMTIKAIAVIDSRASPVLSQDYTIQTAPPPAPQGFTATPGDGQVALSWAAPINNGGSVITKYQVQKNSDAWVEATGLTHTFTGLTNGTSYTFKVRAVNAIGDGAEASESATPTAAPLPGTAPNITTASLPSGKVGEVYNQTLAADGDTPITWSVSVGNLPDGLDLDGSTGIISGTPTTAETANFTVKAANGTAPDATKSLRIVINPAAPPVISEDTPTVTSQDPINLDLSGINEGYIQISLGASTNIGDVWAGQASIITTGSAIQISPTTLDDDDVVTVTGLSVGTNTIEVAFTGGNVTDASYDKTITVNVTDSFVPPATNHTVTFNLNGGTRTGGGALVQTIADGGNAVAPSTTRSGYSFSGWDKAFTNVRSDLTVTALWSQNGGGGNSSSSGNNNYVPSAPPIINTDKQPNMPTTAKTTVTGTVANKVNTVNITGQMAKDAIKAAQDASKSSGKVAAGIAVRFDISNTSDYESISVKYDREALQALKDAGVKYVMIGSAVIDLTLDAKAIDAVLALTTGTVTFSASKQDNSKLSNPAKSAIESRPVFDITIKDVANKTVTDLKGGFATIGIAYKPTSTENTGNLQAVYVKSNGQIEWQTGCSYTGGKLIFKRGTLSVYGVGYRTPAPSFSDTTGHWAKDDIDFVVSRGLINGTGTSTFAPNTAITRATFLMALGKLSGADVSSYKTSSFSDVPATNPAMPYIEWEYKSGIVKGIGDDKFGPDTQISRQDMAVMMVNYAKATGYKLPVSRTAVTFADNSSISAYAVDAIKAIQQAGIMSGKDGNKFDPKGNTTRAEASAILRRFVESVIDEGSARGWNKNESGNWQYINSNGKAVTGWLTSGENKYYFDDKGVMVSGKWLEIDKKWYYFNDDGKMAVNTNIDGYEVGADGVRK